MTKWIKTSILLVTLSGALLGQPNKFIGDIGIVANPPNPVPQSQMHATPSAAGAFTYYYWVAVNYPVGQMSPVGPVVATNAAQTNPATVLVTWPAQLGATNYTIVKQTTAIFNGACTACAVTVTPATVTDTGLNFVNNFTGTGINSFIWYMIPNNRDQSYPFLQVQQEFHIAPTRSSNAYSYLFEVLGVATGGSAQKTYGLASLVTRPAGYGASGDSNDAAILGQYSNYAANDNNFIIRGGNFTSANRSGGNLYLVEGANIGASNKSGATALTSRGMTITADNFGTLSNELGGIDLLLDNEGAKATLEYGIRIRNQNASLATAVDAAILITTPGAANTGFNYGIDLNGAKIVTADVRLHQGNNIYSGNGAPAAGLCAAPTLGSIYLNLAGGAGSSLYVCEVAGAWQAK